MSKQLYDEIQSFLLDKWGPHGGWCQAVMFAADLPVATTSPKKAKYVVKQELSSASPVSAVLETPNQERVGWIDTKPLDSPLKSREKRKSNTENLADLPAGYGFKRTRSAARIELHRSPSSITRYREAVDDVQAG